MLCDGEAEFIGREPHPTEVGQRDSLSVWSSWFLHVQVEKVRTERVDTCYQACVRWVLLKARGDDRVHRAVV